MDFLAVGQRLSGLIEDRFTPTESEGYDESEEPEELSDGSTHECLAIREYGPMWECDDCHGWGGCREFE